MASAMSSKVSAFQQCGSLSLRAPQKSAMRAAPRRQMKTQAISDTVITIAGATAASLALGRFVFMPVQRSFSERAGPPRQNGEDYVTAGDTLATPATFLLSSNDPSGFNLIDVLAYGSLGHAFGYFILATNSLQAAHIPTF